GFHYIALRRFPLRQTPGVTPNLARKRGEKRQDFFQPAQPRLVAWVAKYKPLAEKAKASFRKNVGKLTEAQKELDNAAGTGSTVGEPTASQLENFVQWLGDNRTLPGAAHLVKLHNDRVIQRQQGHVKQCFSGAFRFLQEYPSWIPRLADATDVGIFRRGGPLLSDWSSHLQTHANASNDMFSYATLRAELPPSYGGAHRSGGGASTTLKRMLSLVALFMLDRSNRPNNQL
ncbi:MAG: hypothetical protein ACLQNE_24635, partial [Thermoguttaceae bacterium]